MLDAQYQKTQCNKYGNLIKESLYNPYNLSSVKTNRLKKTRDSTYFYSCHLISQFSHLVRYTHILFKQSPAGLGESEAS